MAQSLSNEGVAPSSGAEKSSRDVAVVGMSCRLPGAPNIDAYWRLLKEERNAIIPIPPDRWDRDAEYDPVPGTPGKTQLREAGFIEGVDQFDPYFFNIAPREAAYQDPQQRLLLELGWEAMEDAGLLVPDKRPTDAGVFVGYCHNDYAHDVSKDIHNAGAAAAPGSGSCIASGRLSTFFGFHGPCMTVDTACSSSLLAVHLACQSIRAGECDTALVGGVNLILHPGLSVAFSQAHLLSPDCRCQAFSEHANGFVRSEGAVVAVLRRADLAMREGDRIYAVIRGTGVSNDGAESPIMAPSEEAQVMALRRAYADAGIDPAQVDYIEAHGTGTKIGDLTETAALNRVVGRGRAPGNPCLIGSGKTNIGHTEAAAGASGFVKAVLSVDRREIPPCLVRGKLNPEIPWDDLALEVQQTSRKWPDTGRPALAGVNSFGISGTNVHVIIEEPPPRSTAPSGQRENYLLTLSAKSESDLKAIASSYAEYFASEASKASTLAEITNTAGAHRARLGHRLAVTAPSREQFAEKLSSFTTDAAAVDGLATGFAEDGAADRPVFVYSGVGSWWIEMGRRLRERETVFRDALIEVDALFQELSGWSPADAIDEPEATSKLGEMYVQQPAIFCVQVALTALWRSWGIEPAAVVGHSLGEHAAAFACGALSLKDAARTVALRSQLMVACGGKGRMLAVAMSAADAEKLIDGREDRLSVGVVNSPSSSVLSGDPDLLDQIREELEAKELFCRWVRTDVASHSPQMDQASALFAEQLGEIQPRAAKVPFYSALKGGEVPGDELDVNYWAANIRRRVRFAEATEQLLKDGFDTFIEVSPHPMLLTPIRQCNAQSRGIASMRRDTDDEAGMLHALGTLHVLGGAPVDWNSVVSVPSDRRAKLPSYAWQRERFWTMQDATETRPVRYGLHPMLDRHSISPTDPAVHVWETEISAARFRFVADHVLEGSPLMPAVGYLEMALGASIERYGKGPRIFENVSWVRPLSLVDREKKRTKITLKELDDKRAEFRVYSLRASTDAAQDEWILHCSGRLQHADCKWKTSEYAAPTDEQLDRTFPRKCDGATFYASRSQTALTHGPQFEGVVESWYGISTRGAARLRMPEAITDAHRYHFHPGLWDSAYQPRLQAHVDHPAEGKPDRLPSSVKRIEVRGYPQPGQTFWSEYERRPGGATDTYCSRIFDEQGNLLLVEDEHLASSLQGRDTDFSGWKHELVWRERPGDQPPSVQGTSWVLVGGGASSAGIAAELAQRGAEVACCAGTNFAEELDRVLEASATEGQVRIVYLDGADLSEEEVRAAEGNRDEDSAPPLVRRHRRIVGGALALAKECARRGGRIAQVRLVTRGVRDASTDDLELLLARWALLGLGRVFRTEAPLLRPGMIDLAAPGFDGEVESLVDELARGGEEREVALGADGRYVRRLAHLEADRDGTVETTAEEGADDAVWLETTSPGMVDRLGLRARRRRAPQDDEVEVRVSAVGLNFIDVLRAYGMYPGLDRANVPFGLEAAGRIVRVGRNVAGLAAGDEVSVVGRSADSGVAASFVTLPASGVLPKPKPLTHAQAASTFVVYQTAHYSLINKAGLRAGESVLIHSAAGGVGLAAMAIAKSIGARIFVTAGTPEKRRMLQDMGAELVMDSHALDFTEEILEYTEGRGVDVALNSLAGPAIPKTLEALAIGGRFIEIGKRDIYADTQVGLLPFQKNLSYFAVDLLRLGVERPDDVAEVSAEIARLIDEGAYPPLPVREFPAESAADAFRFMATGSHVGKVVVTFGEEPLTARAPSRSARDQVRNDGTYLITGGFGGIGLAMAEWLVAGGARSLALVGRRGETAESRPALERIRNQGVELRAFAVDIGDADQTTAMIEQIRADMPPLRGVIHGAGVLADGVLANLDWESFERVFEPKALGAWNLHHAVAQDDLDFFALFSSVSSAFGSGGQANYAAANSALDGLALYRRQQGLPAVSIQWGLWSDIGMGAHLQDSHHQQGIGAIGPDQGVKLFGEALAENVPVTTLLPIDWRKWLEAHPEGAAEPFLEEVLDQLEGVRGETVLAERLALVEDEQEGLSLIEEFLAETLHHVLGIPTDRYDPRTPLNRLGLDSLMTVELQIRIELGAGASIPVVWLMGGVTGAEVAERLWDEVRSDSPTTVPAESATTESDERVDVADLADEDADEILDDVLESTAGA